MNKFNNKVQLVGPVSGIQVFETKNGMLYSTFSVLTTETFFTKEGEKHTQDVQHACIAYNKKAAFLRDHVFNGNQIGLEGRLIHMPTTIPSNQKQEILVSVSEVINLY